MLDGASRREPFAFAQAGRGLFSTELIPSLLQTVQFCTSSGDVATNSSGPTLGTVPLTKKSSTAMFTQVVRLVVGRVTFPVERDEVAVLELLPPC